MDWQSWHDAYDLPDSPLSRRLRAVQSQVRAALDAAPPGPLTAVSLCAGQGRDLLEVLAEHPRREDVRARLVELDPGNTDFARRTAEAAGLHRVEVVTGDAARPDAYAELVPADLVLVCGVFGNITDADIERTVDACTQLCRTGATVIWTRHRARPDRVPQICDWFEERGFERRWIWSEDDEGMCVGVHRFTAEPSPLATGRSLFSFIGYDALRERSAVRYARLHGRGQ